MACDLRENRRRLMLAAPHKATLTGASSVLIAEPKVEELKVTFSQTQTGSGAPSPDNVRPITGWSTIQVNIGSETKSINLGDTYYGGTVDLVSGTLTVTHINKKFSDIEWEYQPTVWSGRFRSKNVQYGTTPPTAFDVSESDGAISSIYESFTNISSRDKAIYTRIGASGEVAINFKDSRFTTVNAAMAVIGNETLSYPISPMTVQLTPQTITALRGLQTVSSPAGSVDITYWTH